MIFFSFWGVLLYNTIIFCVTALKYWSKLRRKCIRTQTDTAHCSTDGIYLMTFDPQPAVTSVLYLIYVLCCGGSHLCLIIHCWSVYFLTHYLKCLIYITETSSEMHGNWKEEPNMKTFISCHEILEACCSVASQVFFVIFFFVCCCCTSAG